MLILICIFFLKTIHSLDIFVSSANNIGTPGNGTLKNPYFSLMMALKVRSNDKLLVFLLPSGNPYVFDEELIISQSLEISSINSSFAVITFFGTGNLILEGNYDFILEGINITQSSPFKFHSNLIIVSGATSFKMISCNNYQIGINSTFFSFLSTNQILISNSTFSQNQINNNFIKVFNVSKMVIENCVFTDSLISEGFYIFSIMAPLQITDSIFKNINLIDLTNINSISSLLRVDSYINVTNTIFEDNSLSNFEIIHIENNDLNEQKIVNFSNVKFLSNIFSGGLSSAISIIGENIYIIMENSDFVDNVANSHLLEISNTLNYLNIINVLLLNNSGSALVFLNLVRTIIIFQIRFISNNYNNFNDLLNYPPGNCLTVLDFQTFQLESSFFLENFALSTLTGIIFEHTSNYVSLDIRINDITMTINEFICSNNVVNASLKNLLSPGNCLLFNNYGEITMTNCMISNNIINPATKAQCSGNPCLLSLMTDLNLNIINSQFIDNRASCESSCLKFYGNQLILKNSSFLNNRAIKSGSPFQYSVDNEGGSLHLGAYNMIFENILIYNSSALRGAAIFFHNVYSKTFQSLNAMNVSMIKNEGVQTSAIEFDVSLNLGNFSFCQCLINSNKVEFYGVVSTFYYTNFNVYFFKSEISYNWGTSAGSAFSFYHFGGYWYFNQSKMIGNILTENVFIGGAALFVYGTTYYTFIYVKNCQFINNTSVLKGGAIQTIYGQVHVLDSEFIDNDALYGGAVSVGFFCPGSYRNVIVRSSKYALEGNAFYFSDQSQIILDNISIYDCKALKGAGIYAEGSTMTFTFSNLNFYNVTAEEGAALWILNTLAGETVFLNISIVDCETSLLSLINIDSIMIGFQNLNISRSHGRVFYINNSTLSAINIKIHDHQCFGEGKGCIGLSQEQSVIIVNEFQFEVNSNYDQDSFYLSQTSIYLSGVSIMNSTSKSESILVYAVESCFVILEDSCIGNLANALMITVNSELLISNCSFFNFRMPKSYGLIQVMKGLNVYINSVNFTLIYGKYGTCISFLGEPNLQNIYDYQISHVIVKNCNAVMGGAFYFDEQNIEISDSSFINNSVNNSGGSLFFGCKQEMNYKWLIKNSSFINNTALQGGAFHSNRYIPEYDNNCKFINNSAVYGPDFSAFPIKLTLEIDNEMIFCDQNPSKCYFRKNITSGELIFPIIIDILDYYNQKIVLLEGSGLLDIFPQSEEFQKIENSGIFSNYSEDNAFFRPHAIFTGVKTQRLSNGSFNFSKVMLQSEPPSNAWLQISTDLIPIYYSEFLKNDSYFDFKDPKSGNYFFLFKIFIRQCVSGEIYSKNGTECYVCPKGKYSFDFSDTECKTCPPIADCKGGKDFSLHPGFWRPNELSDDVYKCNSLSGACLGQIDSHCLYGYDGILCGNCLFNDTDKFFKKGMYYCTPCTEVWVYIVMVIAASFLICGFLVFLVSRKEDANGQNYVLVKLITNHITTISFISNLKIEFPMFIQNFISVQAPVSSIDSFVFTVGCFKDSIPFTIYELKLGLSIALTAAIIIMVISIYLIVGWKRGMPRMKTFLQIINALVIIASFFQPAFVNFYIQNLSCDVINDKSYMTYNLEQECWDKSFTKYSTTITIPFLGFWMMVFPLIFLVFMTKNKHKLNEGVAQQITRFFKAGYKKETYFWEFIQMSRKFSVILLTTFLRNKPESVVYILLGVITIYFILHVINHPYEASSINYNLLETMSLNACFITYYSMVFYLEDIKEIQKTILLSFILVSNGVFLFWWTEKYLLVLKGRITLLLQTSLSKSTTRSSKTRLFSLLKKKKKKNQPKKNMSFDLPLKEIGRMSELIVYGLENKNFFD